MKLLYPFFVTTLMMAGGDVIPPKLENNCEVCKDNIEPESPWKIKGEGIFYYQTMNRIEDYLPQLGQKNNSLFNKNSSSANIGLKLKLSNKNILENLGVAVAINTIGTLGLDEFAVDNVMQKANSSNKIGQGGWVGEAYFTYLLSNSTAFKVGRQELPYAISLAVFSERWNVFSNTYDAGLILNNSLPQTLLIGGYIWRYNNNDYSADMNSFIKSNEGRGMYMFIARNKSIEDITISAVYYYVPDFIQTGVNSRETTNVFASEILWNIQDYTLGIQNGNIITGGIIDDTQLFSAKISKKFENVNTLLAFSYVNDGNIPSRNVGGRQTVLYTQMVINEEHIQTDNKSILAKTDFNILNGKVTTAFGMTFDNKTKDSDYKEFDLIYKTSLFNNSTDLTTTYALQNDEEKTEINHLLRVVARYKF